VVVVGRAPGSAPAGLRDPELARRDAAPVGAVASRQPALPAPPGSLVRDPQLDRYLEAHQEFAGSSALGVPSAFLRSATLVQDGGR
jgi:sigma-E factor negative regulatory protein RseA